MSGADWSQLPGELVDAIMRRLTKVADVICFQAVCKPWRQAILVYDEQLQRHRPPKFRQTLPWLMCHYENRAGHNCFLDVAANNNKLRHVDLPQHRVSRGAPSSPSGWRLTRSRADLDSTQYSLSNPSTGNQIPLPLLPRVCVIDCFAMSSNEPAHDHEECIIVIRYAEALVSSQLAFCKLGAVEHQQQQWRSIPDVEADIRQSIWRIVFWRGRLYGVCCDGTVVVCDLDGPNEQPVLSWASLKKICGTVWYDFNLVVSPTGELMLVVTRRKYFSIRCHTFVFTVYKINEDRQRWDEVESIGDFALFVDMQKIIYVSIKDHPECRKNCVYYNLGVYSIDSKEVELFSFDRSTLDDDGRLTCDSWIFPSN